MDRRFAIGGAAGAAGLLLALSLVLGVFPGISTSSPPPTSDGGCTQQVHFFANDAPLGTNFFGPMANGSVEQLNAELLNRRCSDPALTVAHAHTWGLPGFAELNGDEAFAAKTRELIATPGLWKETIASLRSLEGGSTTSLERMSGSYETLYMLTGVVDVPLIRKAAPDRPEFAVIRFVRPDGYTVNFKLDCGFQPVGQFPGVPPLEGPPPEPTPPPEGPPPSVPDTPNVPSTTVPTRVCPPNYPYGRWENGQWVCKDSPANDPAPRGNAPPQVQGHAPAVDEPASPPAAGDPPLFYAPPPPPPPVPAAPGAEPPQPDREIPPNEGAPPENPVTADPEPDEPPPCDPRICTV